MSVESQSPRHKFFVDCEVQTTILIRTSIYGLALSLYFAITLICTQWMNEPDRGLVESLAKCFEDTAYWLPGLLLLAPIAAHDLLKMTNQFAGPVTRLKREMKLLVEDKSDRPLSFREDDYWVELTSTYNQIRFELLQLRSRLAEQETTGERSTISSVLPPAESPSNTHVGHEADVESNDFSNGDDALLDELLGVSACATN